MYRKYAVKFHKKQVQFINCVNMTERIRKARALPSGTEHLGVKRYIVRSTGLGKKTYLTMRDCD